MRNLEREEGPGGLGDNVAGLEGLEVELEEELVAEHEEVAEGGAAPAPTTAWPGQEFSVNRGFF